ncbi:unnamed protein product [Porites evermanni]|uniref:Uncharacterized protein n=1 Tax=Porites evermanni TaxID=104178 RepID=A0ABN8RG64_9CNID|nr:unnamed protein product [Porites evermanni]
MGHHKEAEYLGMVYIYILLNEHQLQKRPVTGKLIVMVKIRSVDGTENSLVEALHTFLRSSHDDENAGLGCWSADPLLIKELRLIDFGLFNGSDPVHQECIRFCFMQILSDGFTKLLKSGINC